MPGSLHVLGSQRPDPNVPAVLSALPGDGRVVLISAGWRFEETDAPDALRRMGIQVVHLPLYEWFEVIRQAAPELDAAWKERQQAVLGLKATYRARVKCAIEALGAVNALRAGGSRVAEEEWQDALADVRRLDERVQARTTEIVQQFPAAERPWEHPAVREHYRVIEFAWNRPKAVMVAGGHVGVLVSRLRFFGVPDLLRAAWRDGAAILAWSAGAMALSERIVLFYDDPPEGEAWPEVMDRGIGLFPGAVFLPHARRRLRLDDAQRVGILANRFGPAPCVGLEMGAHLQWEGGEWVSHGKPGTALWLTGEGAVVGWESRQVEGGPGAPRA